MEISEFVQMKKHFAEADTDGKIEIYVSARGLSSMQYKELLTLFPFSELYKLEEALG